jgi:hypothetical protein
VNVPKGAAGAKASKARGISCLISWPIRLCSVMPNLPRLSARTPRNTQTDAPVMSSSAQTINSKRVARKRVEEFIFLLSGMILSPFEVVLHQLNEAQQATLLLRRQTHLSCGSLQALGFAVLIQG